LHDGSAMRLVAGALALTLFASFARAEDTSPPEPLAPAASAASAGEVGEGVAHGKIPFRVVRVMAQSHQALLFDRARGTHVLAEIGAKIDGYAVEAIDDEEVTLRFEGTQIVLAAPPHGGSRRHGRSVADRDAQDARDVRHVRSAAGAGQPDRVAGDPTPVDPYGEPAIRVVEAPGAAERDAAGSAPRAIEAGEGGVRVAAAPGSMTLPPSSGIRVAEAPGSVAGPEAKAPDVRPAAAPRALDKQPDKQTIDARAMADVMSSGNQPRAARTPAPPVSPAADPRPAVPVSDIRTVSAVTAGTAGAITLPRGEVDRALADFAGLAAAVRGSFSASGLVVDAVGEGTVFQRAGLRAGDVITAVDGARLRSLDDAANLYARASTASALTAQIVRGGTPMTLHVAIQ
jgi:PDZ domain